MNKLLFGIELYFVYFTAYLSYLLVLLCDLLIV